MEKPSLLAQILNAIRLVAWAFFIFFAAILLFSLIKGGESLLFVPIGLALIAPIGITLLVVNLLNRKSVAAKRVESTEDGAHDVSDAATPDRNSTK